MRQLTLVGCSDGAVVALMVAQRRPDLVRRLVFVAGVFHVRCSCQQRPARLPPPGDVA